MCSVIYLTTLEGFTTMVANEGLEKAEPMDPGPPGPTALHPLRRMRCELFQVKRLQELTYSFFRVELSQLLEERKSPMAMMGFEPATFRLAVECFNHSATSHPLALSHSGLPCLTSLYPVVQVGQWVGNGERVEARSDFRNNLPTHYIMLNMTLVCVVSLDLDKWINEPPSVYQTRGHASPASSHSSKRDKQEDYEDIKTVSSSLVFA